MTAEHSKHVRLKRVEAGKAENLKVLGGHDDVRRQSSTHQTFVTRQGWHNNRPIRRLAKPCAGYLDKLCMTWQLVPDG